MSEPNDAGRELARLPIEKMQDVLLARFVGRELAAKKGFGPAALTRIGTAISEITRNVVQHAGGPGEIVITEVVAGGKTGLRMMVTDKGKGMEQPLALLKENDRAGLGSGLAGTHKLMDEFSIASQAGVGTAVKMQIWKQELPA